MIANSIFMTLRNAARSAAVVFPLSFVGCANAPERQPLLVEYTNTATPPIAYGLARATNWPVGLCSLCMSASSSDTAITNITWPVSTPTLNINSASGTSFCGTSISESAPAKPSPCTSPNASSQNLALPHLEWSWRNHNPMLQCKT